MEKTFTFHAVTYGCRVNQYETQAIREWWQSLGGTETDDPAEADVVLVDSCAVTAEAVSDARQMTRRLGRINPRARIFAAGCAASAEPGDFDLPGVAAVIPQRDKFVLLRGHPLEMTDFSVAEEERPRFAPFSIGSFRRARPVVKVQDGCSQGCAYCIIPLTRGPARSRPVDEILAETARLLHAGYREIMISGVNLRQFHADGADGRNFWSLLRRMDAEFSPEWQGRARFRLSSLEPAQVTDAEALETLEASRMVCPHLHLSLQSGSMAVLRRMGRSPYSPEGVAEAVGNMRRFWPVMGLGADILMGFPGESEAETEETLAMLRALPMTYAHVFPYSVRPGTRAAVMQNQLPKKVRQEHAARVRALMAEKHREFLQAQLAQPLMKVAFDSADARHGNNEWYADCRMEDDGQVRRDHELVDVVPVRVEGNLIMVRPIGEASPSKHTAGE